MKKIGFVLTFLCLIAALVFIWMGSGSTFEAPGLLAQFEGTPRAGWDYWIQKKFWSDVRSFAQFLAIGGFGFLLPFAATLCSYSIIRECRRVTEWIFFGISLLYSLILFSGLYYYLRVPSVLTLVPVILFLGGLFSTVIFWLRARYPHDVSHKQPR